MTRCALLVIGGGPAGHAAAAAFREVGGSGRVVLVSAEAVRPYFRPPLSKDYLRGESGEEELPLEDEQFYADRDIELDLGLEVVSLDPDAGTAALSDGRSIEFEQAVLTTGAEPSTLDVPGADRALSLRSLASGRSLRERAAAAGTAVVIGSGFIGCEAASSLAARGLTVVQVSRESAPQTKRLGSDVAQRLCNWLGDAGVALHRVAAVARIGASTVELTDGTVVPADLVLAAVGVTPRAELAERAGLAVSDGRVLTDSSLRTSHPRVLAAGDLVLAENAAAGRRLAVEHWGDADRMGEIAGTVAAGGTDTWAQAPGFWSEIAGRTLKYAAWGDGFDEHRLVEHGDGFTVWYSDHGRIVGVLTHQADDDYEHGIQLLEQGA